MGQHNQAKECKVQTVISTKVNKETIAVNRYVFLGFPLMTEITALGIKRHQRLRENIKIHEDILR
jgi:hypothetical protein